MPTSTAIPAVEAAIFETLELAVQEDPALAGVKVSDSDEPSRAKEYAWIWHAKAKRDWKGMGRRVPHLEEKIEVTLRVVAIGGKDTKAAKTRALEIVAGIEGALRANLKLDGNALRHMVEELDQESLDFDSKPGCHVLMKVVADCRIRN